MDSEADRGASKLTGFSLALGVGILLGWKLRKWTFPNSLQPNLSEWMTPKYKLVLVVRGDVPNWNRAKLAEHCSSASILALKTSRRQTPISSFFWTLTGQAKVVVKTNTGYEFGQLCEEASKRKICTSIIKERIAQETTKGQIGAEEKSMVLAVGPGPSTILDQITGNLKLY